MILLICAITFAVVSAIEALQHNQHGKYLFFKEHGKLLSSLIMIAVVAVIAISFVDLFSIPYEKTSETTKSTDSVTAYDADGFVSSDNYYYYLRIAVDSKTSKLEKIPANSTEVFFISSGNSKLETITATYSKHNFLFERSREDTEYKLFIPENAKIAKTVKNFT